jgi:hypothetical protein
MGQSYEGLVCTGLLCTVPGVRRLPIEVKERLVETYATCAAENRPTITERVDCGVQIPPNMGSLMHNSNEVSDVYQ